MKTKDFQEETAQHIVDLFNSGKNRVLLADEVGLGKTIVSRRVVELMKQNAESFKVIYVCSNQNIISQNAEKLGIEKVNVLKLSESRLSTQHRTLYEKKNQKEYLIPITPSTSLDVTKGYGNAYERAMIYTLIEEDFDDAEKKDLKCYLDVYASKNNAGEIIHTYEFSENSKFLNFRQKEENKDYYNCIREKLVNNASYKKQIETIKTKLNCLNSAQTNNDDNNRKRPGINELRNIFCEISLSMLEPDLVIMDEFQRYNDLIKTGDTEQKRLTDKLFNCHAKILLVSATPYKPYDTIGELNQGDGSHHFEEFMQLMKFLMGDEIFQEFKKTWKEYSDILPSVSSQNIEYLIEVKNKAEEMLRNYIVRTERYQPNLETSPKMVNIIPTPADIDSYIQMRTLLQKASVKIGEKAPSYNIDYSKSAPFLLSFMSDYAETRFLKKSQIRKGDVHSHHHLLLNYDDIQNNKVTASSNARLKAFYDLLFAKAKNSALLLWVPTSKPYYNTHGIYNACADFSKFLVFSKWGFVPRMLATMLSMISRQEIKYKTKEENKKESNTLYKYRELLLSPFCNIADNEDFRIDTHNGCDVQRLQKIIKENIEKNIKKLFGTKIKKDDNKKATYNLILGLMKSLNKDTISQEVSLAYNDRILTILANIIIASPGICLYRCFKDDYLCSLKWEYLSSAKNDDENQTSRHLQNKNTTLFTFAVSLLNMLGNTESEAVIKSCTAPAPYYAQVLEYCVEGNLQAVIDEYAYVLGYTGVGNNDKSELWKKMDRSIINRTNLDIETQETFFDGRTKKKSISIWYACDFANQSKNDDKTQERNTNVQSAFNSPFRPFVLASTSVGQEGLDFHLYCRKIVHWNIPANPVNFEQRFGRINRYEGLAIRRSLAHLFPNAKSWKDIFQDAEEAWKQYGYNNMVPHWCLPKEVIEGDTKSKIEFIENLFMLYPMSIDDIAMSDLIEKQRLYRLTMGQADQEFIMEILRSIDIEDDKLKELMFNLSPSKKTN